MRGYVWCMRRMPVSLLPQGVYAIRRTQGASLGAPDRGPPAPLAEASGEGEGFVMSDDQTRTGPSRRRLLAGTGAAGAGLMAASAGVLPGVAGSARASTAGSALQRGRLSPGVPPDSGFFGRIFPGLAPFADATDTVRAALLQVGMQGGIMDAGDDLAAGPKNLIVDPAVNGNPTAANLYGTNPDHDPGCR